MRFQRGVTLIEIIIAIFVLAVGLVAVLQMFPLGTHLAKSGEMTTLASLLAQGKMETGLSRSYADLSAGTVTENYGDIADFSGFKRTTAVNCVRPSDLSAVDCQYDLVNDPNPVKKIEVTVYWKNPLGVAEKNINLVSLISRR